MNEPAWNLESEYPSLDSKKFQDDFAEATSALTRLEADVPTIKKRLDAGESAISAVQEALLLQEKIYVTGHNLAVYLSCTLSVDAKNSAARAKESEIETLMSRMNQAILPLKIYLQRCDDKTFADVLAHPGLKGYTFLLAEQRKLKPFLLSEEAEVLTEALSVSGHQAWGNLYDDLSGKLTCKMGDKTVGLAHAHAVLFGTDEHARKQAWNGIQATWTEHRESAAAILNALAGWRLELNRKRAHTKPVHFLDLPAFRNRVERATIDAMFAACRSNIEKLREAPRLSARMLGKVKLDPWDLVSSSPVSASGERSFEEGLELVRSSFACVDPALGEFVTMMAKNNWIEGRVLPNKRTGAYCTRFPKSREPRVFQTFMGSLANITTLAHELGHAFHGWVLRELPRGETAYPMTLAETASVFAETVLRDSLLSKANGKAERAEFAWGDLQAMTAFLINIPVRFEFEKSFYEKRATRAVSADELSSLMSEAWNNWYGDTVSTADPLFWAHKLHFSMARSTFYNFPYTFGYLFSLSIYARKAELGARFMPTYLEILRDTGRMTAEDLVQKHFGEDIRRPEFWQKSIDVVCSRILEYSAQL